MLGDPKQAYTWPDRNQNRLAFVAAKGSRFVDDTLLVGGSLYYRRYTKTNVSSNVNDDYGEADDAATSTNEAFNDRSTIDQQGWGAGVQLTKTFRADVTTHELAAGVTGDFGRTRFTQDAQTADFTAYRGTVATGPFVSTPTPTSTTMTSAPTSPTPSRSTRNTLTLAGRYNRAKITIADRTGAIPRSTARTRTRASHPRSASTTTRRRAAPPTRVQRRDRAPTPIELTCADPTRRAGSRTSPRPSACSRWSSRDVELGARGKLGAATTWAAAAYRTDLYDDIQFVASGSGATNAGYFQNVGRTRRQGVELIGAARAGDWSLDVRYAYIDATFSRRSSNRARTIRARTPRGDRRRARRPDSRHSPQFGEAARRVRACRELRDRRQHGLRLRTVCDRHQNNQDK